MCRWFGKQANEVIRLKIEDAEGRARHVRPLGTLTFEESQPHPSQSSVTIIYFDSELYQFQLIKMGWLWSSTAPPASTSTAPSTTPSEPTLPPRPSQQHLPSETPKRQPTRDEIAEYELHDLLAELEADARPSSTKYNRVPQPPPSHKNRPAPSNLTLEDDLLPTEMSCRQAFDAAFYCQSLGGQFNNLYRYGGIRSCSENWRDFWFCMRMKSYKDKEKEGMLNKPFLIRFGMHSLEKAYVIYGSRGKKS